MAKGRRKTAIVAEGESGIRFAIHDASRVEWVTSVPLPETRSEQRPFCVEFELEVPAQLFVAQDQWRPLQIMSRLQSPAESHDDSGDGLSADRLRELALAFAHRVKAYRDELTRECLLANCLMSSAAPDRQLDRLLIIFRVVEAEVAQLRGRLATCKSASPRVVSERALVAEFVSNHLLEFLFQARRSVDEHLLRAGGPNTESLRDTAAAFGRAIQEPLQRELAYRTELGFLTPTTEDPELLEKYLERASQLKKHFHELLFLAADTTSTDVRLRSYGTAIGAMMASVFGFTLNKTGVLGHSASLGLVAAALVGAIVYAMQDRIKELGKTYLPNKLGKRYAQRVTRLLAPPRGDASQGKLVGTIEESITAKLVARPDPLNPELGACRSVHVVRYSSQGVAEIVPELNARRIHSFKQIFRYDLSWLFARLDDARKQVPVLGVDGLRVAEAPRWYRLPVRVKLCVGDHCVERRAIAVVHKRGLERLELDTGQVRVSASAAPLASAAAS
jgi:hypothetical protein